MTPIVAKLRAVGRAEAGGGRLRFYGLFRPPGARRWDVVVAADGERPDDLAAWRYLSGLLRRALTPQEIADHIGQAVVLDPSDPRLSIAGQTAGGRRARLRDVTFGDVDLAEAYIVVPAPGVPASDAV